MGGATPKRGGGAGINEKAANVRWEKNALRNRTCKLSHRILGHKMGGFYMGAGGKKKKLNRPKHS